MIAASRLGKPNPKSVTDTVIPVTRSVTLIPVTQSYASLTEINPSALKRLLALSSTLTHPEQHGASKISALLALNGANRSMRHHNILGGNTQSVKVFSQLLSWVPADLTLRLQS